MAAIAQLKALLGLDTKEFRAGMRSAEKDAKTGGSAISKALVAAGSAIAGAFSIASIKRFAQSVIGAAADFETLNMQFKVLLGSQEEAQKHMEALTALSAKTPFSIESIAEASQQLYNLSGGLLGGVDSLKLFGDAAAATGNTDLGQLSYWVGRLYGSLKAGRPIIDSINALSRLKMITPEVMKEMIALSDAGAESSQIWEVFTANLQRFEGGMDKLSETTKGKLSTMKDNWKIFFSEIGEAIEPWTKKIIDGLTDVADMGTKVTKLLTGEIDLVDLVMQPRKPTNAPAVSTAGEKTDGGESPGTEGLTGTATQEEEEALEKQIAENSRKAAQAELTLQERIEEKTRRMQELESVMYDKGKTRLEQLRAFNEALKEQVDLDKLIEQSNKKHWDIEKQRGDQAKSLLELKQKQEQERATETFSPRGTYVGQMQQMGGFVGRSRNEGVTIAERHLKLAQAEAKRVEELAEAVKKIQESTSILTGDLE